MTPSSPSYIAGIKAGVADTHQVHFYSKAGGEGAAIFDSAMALLQGLFPPNPNNKITLANETTIVAPLGGYQYVPVETVEPSYDRSLEPWTDCLVRRCGIIEGLLELIRACYTFRRSRNISQTCTPLRTSKKPQRLHSPSSTLSGTLSLDVPPHWKTRYVSIYLVLSQCG